MPLINAYIYPGLKPHSQLQWLLGKKSLVITYIAHLYKISEEAVMRGGKHYHAEARALCYYVFNEKYGHNKTTIGRYFNRDRSTVSSRIKVIRQKLRVDKDFFSIYSQLEDMIYESETKST